MRRALYLVHLYVGLFLGATVVFVGLTGSAVVYRPEIERLLNPEWFRVSAPGEMRSLDDLVANAVRTYPGAVPTFVSIQPPLAAGESAMVVMKDRFGADSGPWIRAHVDPYTGAVLASFDPRQTFSGVLFDLHSSLLVGEHTWGEQIVGVFGIVLLLFCVTGAVLWWPGMRRFTRAFAVRWRRGALTLNYDLHRVAGIVLLIPLTLVTLTGIVLVFPKYTRAPIVAAFDIERPPKAPRSSGGGPRISAEAVRDIVAREYPDARLVGIQLPGNVNAPYHARLLLPGDSKMRYGGGAKLSVWIDSVAAEVLQEHDATSMPVASRLMFEWIFPTHTGDVAGEAGRLLMFASGLVPLALFVTGFSVWCIRRRRKAAALGVGAAPI